MSHDLYDACSTGQLRAVQQIMKWNPTIDPTKGIFRAILNNHTSIVQFFLTNPNVQLKPKAIYDMFILSHNNPTINAEVCDYPNAMESILIEATRANELLYITFAIQMGARNIDNALHVACDVQNYDTVVHLLHLGATDINGAMRYACARGNLHIVNLLIARVTDWVMAIRAACIDNHPHLIATIAQAIPNSKKRTRILNRGVRIACEEDFTDLLIQLFQHGADDYTGALIYSCYAGSLGTVFKVLDLHSKADIKPRYNDGMISACKGGHYEIMYKMIELSREPLDWNAGLRIACVKGNTIIAQRMIEMGAKNIGPCMVIAVHHKHPQIVQLLATRYDASI